MKPNALFTTKSAWIFICGKGQNELRQIWRKNEEFDQISVLQPINNFFLYNLSIKKTLSGDCNLKSVLAVYNDAHWINSIYQWILLYLVSVLETMFNRLKIIIVFVWIGTDKFTQRTPIFGYKPIRNWWSLWSRTRTAVYVDRF